MAASLAVKPTFAQSTVKRAAVVIGINTCPDLPVLTAAVSGARSVAKWLEGEKFEVHRFFDDKAPVRASQIYDVVEALVERGTLEQLVVYFSGHGYLNSTSEWWMLSKAPNNPNEAISMTESAIYAQESGIANVVFISDACRSTPDSLRASRVRGELIFPNRSGASPRAKVDKFYAALPGDAALELPVSDSTKTYRGIYTECFLEAFRKPDKDMVAIAADGRRVVPNQKLEDYLAREVPLKAQEYNITLNQVPDTQVLSRIETYIGHVKPDVVTAEHPPSRGTDATILDVGRAEINRTFNGWSTEVPVTDEAKLAISKKSYDTGFAGVRDSILDASRRMSSATGGIAAGFAITGQKVVEVQGSSNLEARIISEQVIQTTASGVGSVAIRFEDGSGTVVAALKEFVGNLVVEPNGITSLSYFPSEQNWRYPDYQSERERIDNLHAVVSASVRYGVFRIDSAKGDPQEQAKRLAGTIRVPKAIDPSLGIYAAYAYAEAGFTDEVQSVLGYMHEDLEVNLFDVAMLAGKLDGDVRSVPFCPMLTQGWGLLRVKNVTLPQALETARDHLKQSLWTTFDREGMDIVMEAMRNGSLQ